MSVHVENLPQFNGALEKFTRDIPEEHLKPLQQKIALTLLERIVFDTPVDLGRAQNNWQTTVNVSPTTEQRLADPVASGLNTVITAPAYSVIYLTNNVPYIIYLEEGTPKMAPHRMVGRAVMDVSAQFP